MSDSKKWLQAFGLFLAVSLIGSWLANINQYFLLVLFLVIVAFTLNEEIVRKALGFFLVLICISCITIALMIDTERLEETWGINLAFLFMALLAGYGAVHCFTWKRKRS